MKVSCESDWAAGLQVMERTSTTELSDEPDDMSIHPATSQEPPNWPPTLAPLRLEHKHPMINLPRRFSIKAFTCVHWAKISSLLVHCPVPRLPLSLSSDDPYLFLRYNSPFLERDPLFRWWMLWGLTDFSYSWLSPPLTGLWTQAHHGVNCSSAPTIMMSNSGLEV
ncbi:uncharacterized protein BO88DRAFT_430645 [Aspergillus vadensis CBS 113365]|uniref:Uncharacterized protein n=1 Tax=Aspergillus vadensis (strain CBS 113365 / IMI 142717 / IBT 24658) TaxID=1448311 RepID=A0A319ASC5_ASPVC|nr:hypothetical protein BO88DRAFT_430645 [Aspergillus vadensis CBS 113365]PYH63237.1 hypothetical protein BO88DRAFT_430645 [Aspergillus vadensis CBS 113365]